jgi:hypothetical protein
MGKDLRQIEIERAAGNFLCEQPEGSLFGAYLLLVEELEKGNGKDLAANHTSVWEKVDNMTVEDIVEAIENAVVEIKSAPEFLAKMDWKLLRKQKLLLLATINNDAVDPEHKEGLEGILNMIDSMQDYAVDELGIDEAEWDDLEIEEKL